MGTRQQRGMQVVTMKEAIKAAILSVRAIPLGDWQEKKKKLEALDWHTTTNATIAAIVGPFEGARLALMCCECGAEPLGVIRFQRPQEDGSHVRWDVCLACLNVAWREVSNRLHVREDEMCAQRLRELKREARNKRAENERSMAELITQVVVESVGDLPQQDFLAW